MKVSSMFVIGLVVGALTVFGVRAASSTGSDGRPSPPTAADPHAGHDMTGVPKPAPGSAPAPAPAPARAPAPAPAPTPAPAPVASGDASDMEHARHDMKAPENLICPVMGKEVDPDVFIDHEGRRIGFCCPPCIDEFKADPAKFIKKVDAEIAARKGGK